jgi:hypothetical protein
VYKSYALEDILKEGRGPYLTLAKRRSNSTRPHPSGLEKIMSSKRQRVETTFSQITQLLPRRLSDTAAERDHSFLHFTYLDILRP